MGSQTQSRRLTFSHLKRSVETTSPPLAFMPRAHQYQPLCFFPQIKLWDLRTTKCIRQYEGHVNEYAHLPLHVHEEEGIVVAGSWGQGTPSH